jgi:glutaredoxin-related protein
VYDDEYRRNFETVKQEVFRWIEQRLSQNEVTIVVRRCESSKLMTRLLEGCSVRFGVIDVVGGEAWWLKEWFKFYVQGDSFPMLFIASKFIGSTE